MKAVKADLLEALGDMFGIYVIELEVIEKEGYLIFTEERRVFAFAREGGHLYT